MTISIEYDLAPLDKARKLLIERVGVRAVNWAHDKELPNTMRMARARIVKTMGTGLSAKQMRVRMRMKLLRRWGEGKIFVTEGADRISASRYKGAVKRGGITLRGRKGVKFSIPKAFYSRGRYTKRWVVTGSRKQPVSELAPFGFADAFIKAAPPAARRAARMHVKRMFRRLKDRARRGI